MGHKSKYNPNIHHRKSIRLEGYDYSKEGLYFITICCKDRLCLFGKIENDVMFLNDMGIVAKKCWLEIPNHYPNVILHEYIIRRNKMGSFKYEYPQRMATRLFRTHHTE